jgi:fatty acid desaturase
MNRIYLIFDWVIILVCWVLFYQYQNLALFLVNLFIIGTRQHALINGEHDASHGVLFKNQMLNKYISTFFCSWPLGHDWDNFKKYHLLHHRFLNTDFDPAYVPIKNSPDWTFPLSKIQFIFLSLRDLFGLSFKIATFYENLPLREREIKRWLIAKFIFYPILFILIYLVTKNALFSSLVTAQWFIAKYTVMVWLIRIRSIVEHFGPMKHDRQSRDIKVNLVESFIFLPHKVGLHFQHHENPSYPTWKFKYDDIKNLEYGLFTKNGIMWDIIK